MTVKTTAAADFRAVYAADIQPFSGNFNLTAAADDFLQRHTAGLAARTVQTYGAALKTMVSWMSGRVFGEDTVLQYCNETLAGKSTLAARLHIAVIKLFTAYLFRRGLVAKDYGYEVRKPRAEEGFKKAYLQPAEVAAMLAEHTSGNALKSQRDKAIIRLMATCGLRVSEVINLDISDIQAQGAGWRLALLRKGHTEKDAYVNLPAKAKAEIDAYLAMRGADAEPDKPLFASLDHKAAGGRMAARSISRLVKQSMQEAGMDDARHTAHSLRHTAITLAIKGGATLAEAQQMAGHKAISTTMIYNHQIEAECNRAADIVAALF